LGLSKTATPAEVKKAYRTKAKRYHPDTNKEPNAQAKFVAVKEAYECLRDPARRSYYDSTLPGSTSSRNQTGPTRNTSYKAPQWEFREAERKMWDDMKAHRHSRRSEWQDMHKEMKEEMRRSNEREALRKMLSPYFNAALVLSLLALGAGSLYLQYRNRGQPGHVRSFSSSTEPSEYIGNRGVPKNKSTHSIVEDPTDYHTMDPHRKYHTKWDEINQAVKRRDDFYRALLRPGVASDSKEVPHLSKPTL
jgi:curved DNA-binding protein CbpA